MRAEIEKRTSLENPSTPLSYPAEWLLDIFNGGRTDSGIRVSEMTALQVVTVFSCVDIISSSLSSLPLNVYERILIGKGSLPGKRLAAENDLFDLLHDDPNPEMTSRDWRKTGQCHALLWGNSYTEIQRDGGNRPVALWPRNPAKTRPRRNSVNGKMFYSTTDGVDEDLVTYHPGYERPIAAEDMVHVRGLSLDGRIGQDVVNLSRQAMGMSLAMEKFGGKFFGNGAVLGGTLEYPGVLKPEAKSNLERSWREAHGGENQHAWAVLENGVKANQLGTKPNEAQMIEAREFQLEEISRVFHVPPHMLAVQKGQARANVEQIGTEFVIYCLNPWIVAWEQELRRKLFPPRTIGRNAGKRMIVVLDTRKLMLPDADSRQKYYAGGRQWGWLTENAVLEMEDMNPSDNPLADETWMPVNMVLASSAGHAPSGEEPLDAPPGKPSEADDLAEGERGRNLALRAYSRLFSDAFRRFLARDKPDLRAFGRIFEPVLFAVADFFLMNSGSGFSPGSEIPGPVAVFVREYVATMYARSPRLTSDDLDEELARAVTELYGAVGRELQTEVAR